MAKNEKIQIAYVISYLNRNGPSRVLLSLINNLDKSKYEISLITLFAGNDKEIVSALRCNGITVYECETLCRIGCLCGQFKEFSDVINKRHFDILHSHGFVPDILSSRLHTTAKRITTLHSNIYEDYLETYGFIKSRILITWHIAAVKKLDKCVCCSKSVYYAIAPHLSNLTFVCNGLEPIMSKPAITRAEIDVPENARVFIFAGALNSGKNIVKLIDDFVNCHDADEYMLILGAGEKEEECKKRIDDHVRMLGFQIDPTVYMKISDVYVSASKSEGFSISVLEALFCGLGLLLSDIPSHCEVVKMSKDIYLGEVYAASDFSSKLTELREKSFNKKEIIEFSTSELSAETMTKKYEKVYAD